MSQQKTPFLLISFPGTEAQLRLSFRRMSIHIYTGKELDQYVMSIDLTQEHLPGRAALSSTMTELFVDWQPGLVGACQTDHNFLASQFRVKKYAQLIADIARFFKYQTAEYLEKIEAANCQMDLIR